MTLAILTRRSPRHDEAEAQEEILRGENNCVCRNARLATGRYEGSAISRRYKVKPGLQKTKCKLQFLLCSVAAQS